MTHDPAPPRRYDEDQVALILKRATELHQEEPARRQAGSEGLTLAELEDIGAEAGIDRRHLRRAALEVDTEVEGRSFWSRFLGAEVELAHRFNVPGEIHPEDFEGIVKVIQLHSREHGQPTVLGRSLHWIAESQTRTRTIQVSVSARDGETHIQVEERLHQLAATVFGGGLGGIGGGFGVGVGVPLGLEVLGGVGAAVALPLGFLGITYVSARAVYRRVVQRRQRTLVRLMDAIAEEVRKAVDRRSESA